MTQGGSQENRDWGRRAFSSARRRTISALAEALFSTEDERGLVPAPRELAERITDEFDLLIGAGSSDLRRGYRLFGWLLEWLPLFVIGVVARASTLSLARRVAYLHRLEHAKIGLLAMLLVSFKIPLTMIAYEQGAELRVTGFDRDSLAARRLVVPRVPVLAPAARAPEPVEARVAAAASEEVGSR